jgi:hypothetical protein
MYNSNSTISVHDNSEICIIIKLNTSCGYELLTKKPVITKINFQDKGKKTIRENSITVKMEQCVHMTQKI